MFAASRLDYTDKAAFWTELASQARGLLAGEVDAVANAANLSALIFNQLPDVNWAGFYFVAVPAAQLLIVVPHAWVRPLLRPSL